MHLMGSVYNFFTDQDSNPEFIVARRRINLEKSASVKAKKANNDHTGCFDSGVCFSVQSTGRYYDHNAEAQLHQASIGEYQHGNLQTELYVYFSVAALGDPHSCQHLYPQCRPHFNLFARSKSTRWDRVSCVGGNEIRMGSG